MNHLLVGTTNLINKLGDSVKISTRYITKLEADIDDDVITLYEVDGLFVGAKIKINEVEYTVTNISNKTITIDPELTEPVYYEQVLVCESTVNGVPVPRFKRITYELLEFIRKVRVPQETVVTYGSTVQLFDELFFVVGMDPGDHSISLTLKEVNAYITIKRVEKTGFNSLSKSLEDLTIASGIPGNVRYDRADLPMRSGLGYLQTGSFYCMIQKNFPVADPYDFILTEIDPGDIVTIEGDRFKISAFDKFTYKNFISLILTYDSSK